MSNQAHKQPSAQLYQQVYSSAKTGLNAIDAAEQALGDNDPMRPQLRRQRKLYSDMICRSAVSLKQMGTVAHKESTLHKLQTKAGVTAGLMMDRSPSKAAELLIHGATSGITDLQQALNQNPGADQQSKALSQELLSAQQNYIDTMKKYL